jgi:DNA-binding XRE family transcriptional regulator
MEQFKITLAAARVNAGMTQDDVTKALNVSKTTIVN